jgi:hypothetical protein
MDAATFRDTQREKRRAVTRAQSPTGRADAQPGSEARKSQMGRQATRAPRPAFKRAPARSHTGFPSPATASAADRPRRRARGGRQGRM